MLVTLNSLLSLLDLILSLLVRMGMFFCLFFLGNFATVMYKKLAFCPGSDAGCYGDPGSLKCLATQTVDLRLVC